MDRISVPQQPRPNASVLTLSSMATIMTVSTKLLTISFHEEDSFQIKRKVERDSASRRGHGAGSRAME